MNPLLIGPLLEMGKNLVAKLWPDPAQQAEAQRKLLELQQTGELQELAANLQLALAQVELNKTDAQSASNFRGGWRPFIGWVCGVGLMYQLIIRPLANGAFLACGYAAAPMPELDAATLSSLIFGMLGLGGMRSFEKAKGMP